LLSIREYVRGVAGDPTDADREMAWRALADARDDLMTVKQSTPAAELFRLPLEQLLVDAGRLRRHRDCVADCLASLGSCHLITPFMLRALGTKAEHSQPPVEPASQALISR
jgi:hypothetical protein